MPAPSLIITQLFAGRQLAGATMDHRRSRPGAQAQLCCQRGVVRVALVLRRTLEIVVCRCATCRVSLKGRCSDLTTLKLTHVGTQLQLQEHFPTWEALMCAGLQACALHGARTIQVHELAKPSSALCQETHRCII